MGNPKGGRMDSFPPPHSGWFKLQHGKFPSPAVKDEYCNWEIVVFNYQAMFVAEKNTKNRVAS